MPQTSNAAKTTLAFLIVAVVIVVTYFSVAAVTSGDGLKDLPDLTPIQPIQMCDAETAWRRSEVDRLDRAGLRKSAAAERAELRKAIAECMHRHGQW